MPREDYDIVGSFNKQRILSLDAERTVNMFEYIDPNNKKPKALLPTSGLRDSEITFGSTTGGWRADFKFGAYHYGVIGTDVYRIDSDDISVKLNSSPLTTESGFVGIAANTFQVIFVDGQAGYIWDTTANTWTQITDTSFPSSPIDVTYIDGFFVVAIGGTNTFRLCSFDQGMVWGEHDDVIISVNTGTDSLVLANTVNYQTGIPITFENSGGALPTGLNNLDTYYAIRIDSTTIKVATSYANAILGTAINITTAGSGTNTVSVVGQLQQGAITSDTGNIVAVATLHRRVFLFSTNFCEVWENSGSGTNLPLRRNNALLLEYGTPAIGSVKVGFDRLFFLSQDTDGLGPVMEVLGTQAIPVSNPALDYELASFAADPDIGVSDAVGILLKEKAITFYRLNFTNANKTYVFNITMSSQEQLRWHEEEVLNGDRHPAQTHVYFNGVNYVGDYQSPTLYVVDNATYNNNGEKIRRMRIGKPYTPSTYQRIRIDRFQVDLLQGQIQLQISNLDGESNILTEDSIELLTESGITLVTTQGDTTIETIIPYVFLSYSKDGGQTYGNKLREKMGEIGDRTFRTIWRKLGTTKRGQAFVPKIEFFQNAPFAILGAAWAYEVLPE